ncbi:MAG: response regulator [Pirellula sp.]|jgi:CheY-like chemotaxis protein|nr:response regulator [Pirellula sp.]
MTDPIKIFIVDDDKSLIRLIEKQIRLGLGDEVSITTESDSAKAKELISHVDWDIVLTDMDMPDINGFGLLRTIKERSPLSQVIFLTAHPSANAIHSAFALGADEYLHKPIQQESLLYSIRFFAERIKRFRKECLIGI